MKCAVQPADLIQTTPVSGTETVAIMINIFDTQELFVTHTNNRSCHRTRFESFNELFLSSHISDEERWLQDCFDHNTASSATNISMRSISFTTSSNYMAANINTNMKPKTKQKPKNITSHRTPCPFPLPLQLGVVSWV